MQTFVLQHLFSSDCLRRERCVPAYVGRHGPVEAEACLRPVDAVGCMRERLRMSSVCRAYVDAILRKWTRKSALCEEDAYFVCD